MATRIFVNLPVRDLDRAMAFFKALGFSFNEQFTNEEAACLVIAARSVVRECATETVASAPRLASINASGRPTRNDRPTITARAPEVGIS